MPFWEHYQITGDRDFARNLMLPLYREIAAFYEDYLTETDEDGRYLFVPSYSPENWPGNLDHPRCAVVNATMDITVCREVLCHLVELCETFGVEKENVLKWRGMLGRLPPYLYDELGALKEWVWKSLDEATSLEPRRAPRIRFVSNPRVPCTPWLAEMCQVAIGNVAQIGSDAAESRNES